MARGRWSSAALWSVALAFAVALRGASAACRVRLDIDAAASTFSISGTNALTPRGGGVPIQGSITDKAGSATKGFQGAMYADVALSTCPTTQAAWLAALPGLSLTSSALNWYSPITLYPPVLPATTLSFPFQPQSIDLSVNVTGLAVTGSTNNFTGTASVAIVQGWLFTSTPLTADRYDNLVGLAATTSVAGYLTVQGSAPNRVLTLEVPVFSVQLSTPAAQVTVLGSLYDSASTVQLTGRLLLKAVLTCPSYCGDAGRCAVTSGTAACQCECGWTTNATGACVVPSGACSAFGSASTGSTCNATSGSGNSPPAASPPPATITPDSTGMCPASYGISSDTTQCLYCSPGFAGMGCATCQSDAACQALGGSSSTCVRNATYSLRSAAKNYTCGVRDEMIKVLLGETVQFTCSTQAPDSANSAFTGIDLSVAGGGLTAASSPVGASPFCALTFRMPGMVAGDFVRCVGWGCKYGANSTGLTCSVIDCDCPVGCEGASGNDMGSLFRSITGGMNLRCDAPAIGSNSTPSQVCKVEVTGLPIDSITLDCTTSECYDPNAAITLGAATSDGGNIKSQRVGDPVIAALPFIAIGAAAAVFAAAAVAMALPFVTVSTALPSVTISTDAAVPLVDDHATPPSAPQPVAEARDAEEGDIFRMPQSPRGVYVNGLYAPASGAAHTATLDAPAKPPAPARSGSERIGTPSSGSAATALDVAAVKLSTNGLATKRDSRLTLRFLDISAASVRWRLGRGHVRSQVLHRISGAASVGQVTGLMGPSGSGKSTLLNVLSGQVQGGGAWTVTGSIQMGAGGGDVQLSAKQLVQACAYVPQHDLLLRHLTVEESLRCSAALRLGPDAQPAQVHARVEAVLNELNMSHLRHRKPYRGSTAVLSGGERQRLSIGMELVSEPLLLFLDEPTSGLDSYNALQVLTTLRAVASVGRIVITSLHQPSPVIFGMLDQAVLVAAGHLVFRGAPADAPAAFASLGLPCDDSRFIAEHMLEVVCDPDTIATLMEQISTQAFKDAHLAKAAAGHRAISTPGTPSAGAKASSVLPDSGGEGKAQPAQDPLDGLPPEILGKARAPLARQAAVLTWRTLLDAMRNPTLGLMHLAFAVGIGLIVGFVYFKVGDNIAGAQNRVGAIFFVINLFSFLATTALDAIQLERQVVEREMVRRYYSPWLYMALKLLVDAVLLRMLPGVVFSSLFYWLMGLRASAGGFATFLFVFCTYCCLVGALALLVGAMASTAGRALIVLNLLLLLFVLFGGFLVNKSSITWALRWICYLSPMRYAWEALVINELQPMYLTFSAPDLPTIPPVKGRLFLGLLGVNPDVLTTDIVVLNCMWLCASALALGAMALRVRLVRKGLA